MNSPLRSYNCEAIKTKILEETRAYRFFSENEYVRTGITNYFQNFENYISTPMIDIEQTVLALCRAREGKSCAVYSPFYESKYMPYPLILSARSLLAGNMYSSYLVIGGRHEWPSILSHVYRHGDIDNHPLMSDYGFRDILNARLQEKKSKRQRPRKYIRWIFSGFYNSNLWEELDDIALVMVDLISENSHAINRTDLEEILSYSSRKSIPVVFFMKTPLDKVGRILLELGVEIVHPSIILEGTKQPVSPIQSRTHDDGLKTFLTQYNLRSFKFGHNQFRRTIEIKKVEESEKFFDFYRQYSDLNVKLKTEDYNRTGGYVRLLARDLFDSVMEFPGAVNCGGGLGFNWLEHAIGQARESFSDKIHNLSISDDSRDSSDLLLEKADAIMREFEGKPTPKGTVLFNELKKYLQKNLSPIIMGKKNTLENFMKNMFTVKELLVEQLIVTPAGFENANYSDALILLNSVYGRERAKLLTSCTDRIIILNYTWQTRISGAAVEEVKKLVKNWRGETLDTTGKYQTTIQHPESSINLVMTEANNSSNEGSRTEGEKTDDYVNDSIPFYKDLIDADDDGDDGEENYDDFSYLDLMLERGEAFTISKWKIPIENMEIIIPENRNIVVIKENKTYTTIPSHLKKGDLILISKDYSFKTMSDFVWDIMERRLKINRRNHPSNEWRERLKRYMKTNPRMSYSQLYNKLRSYGTMGVQTPSAIYLWLESDDIIGPKDFETLKTIADFLGMTDRLKDWQMGIRTVRSIHNRMMRHIWRVAKYSARKIREESYEDYDVVDPRLGISVAELSNLVRFVTVTGAPKKME
jgi:hypothetical protein